MFQQFESFQKLSKDGVDNALKSFGTVSKGLQAIAVEATDYSKKAFETNTAFVEKLMGAKSLDKVIEIQSEHAKAAYEALVAQSTKMTELYTGLAKEAFKPLEAAVAKATAAAK